MPSSRETKKEIEFVIQKNWASKVVHEIATTNCKTLDFQSCMPKTSKEDT